MSLPAGREKLSNSCEDLNRLVSYKGEILIVDDEPANLDLLQYMLTEQNYDVRVATSGPRALVSAATAVPDLVLLDVNMPEMNGYEVCTRLKADPNTQAVPVIFISSNDETLDKVRAFDIGGVDYITKPYQIKEVLSRVECQLKLARMAKELQMQVLRYQLNPHFLFNALMSIRALVPTNGETAEEMISQLAEYLRYLLLNRNRPEISVREEVDAAQNYLLIEKIRFEENLLIKVDIDPQAEGYLMPAFLIQPLLENAIKYGCQAEGKPLEVEMSVQLKKRKLCLRISNTGAWISRHNHNLPGAASLGVGLQNIRQRLRQRYGDAHSFTISESNGRVSVTIEMPVA